MRLKIFVENCSLYEYYIMRAKSHNQKILHNDYMDAGFDLCLAKKEIENVYEKNCNCRFFQKRTENIVDFGVQMAAFLYLDNERVFPTGYCMYPRSSLSKTKIRLANSVGVIDAGYRGNIIGMFDTIADTEINYFDRIVQICAPSFCPILVEIVKTAEELSGRTERGTGGFGSTNT